MKNSKFYKLKKLKIFKFTLKINFVGFSFSNARTMFESLNKPEIRNGITNLAKNPTVQKAAVSAARNEDVRNAAISAAKNENVRSAAISAAQNPTTRNIAISAAQNPTTRGNILSMAKQFEDKPIMKMQTSPNANTTPNFTSTSAVNNAWGGSGYSSSMTSSYGSEYRFQCCLPELLT